MATFNSIALVGLLALGVVVPLEAQVTYTPYQFTTLAGAQNDPGADGDKFAVEFSGPSGVAGDASGDLFIADTGDNTIREMSPAGIFTTIAGAVGVAGSVDGPGSTARFNSPFGIAVDASGNVYVGDSGNSTIRELKPSVANGVTTWTVSTLAGTAGQMGSSDGTGGAALFGTPTGVALDSSGNLYVADSHFSNIRKIAPGGVVTTFAGISDAGRYGLFYTGGFADGPGATAKFSEPSGVAVDRYGNVYVADMGNCLIRMITPGGVVTTYAGNLLEAGQNDGAAASAIFNFPRGIAVDLAGNVYVADTSGSYTEGLFTTSTDFTIRKITADGEVSSLAGAIGSNGGGFADGTGSSATFYNPVGLGLDADGNIIVADVGNNAIRKVTSSGVVTTLGGISTVGSSDGTGYDARFNGPSGVALDGSGNLYVADTVNNTIRRVTPDGVVTTIAGIAQKGGSLDGNGSAATFDLPGAVAVDGGGNIYVADSANNTIRKITSSYVVSTLAGTPGSPGSANGTGAAARFNDPTGVAVDGGGNVYVADSRSDTIREITPGGLVTTLAGTPGTSGSSDGTGPAALFNSPSGIAVDGAGNLYVADTANSTIRRIAPGGGVTTVAGQPGKVGLADGPVATALFLAPTAVAVDASGNLFVTDVGGSANGLVREITTSGVVTTLAGTAAPPPMAATDVNGTGNSAHFYDPTGIAVDAKGNLYVADTGDDSIRIGSLNLPFTTQPQSEKLNSGSTVVFSAAATGATSYQWELNGVVLTDSAAGTTSDVISGSTGPVLLITNATSASAGSYVCVATDSGGSNPSAAASLTVGSGETPGTIVNLSARGFVGTGDAILIGGFYIGGTTSRTVLIQALGPAMTGEGVSGVLQHPALSIFNTSGKVIYSNTGWGSSQTLLSAAAAVYASPVLQANSNDSEILVTLPPGGYTAQVVGADGGTGVALCAIYEFP
jgi:sugar lactone lactonase YvrE